MAGAPRPPAQQPESMPLATRIRLAVGALALLALLIFLFQNLQDAEVNFLWFEWRTSMVWALLASAAFGAISVLLVTVIRPRRRPDAESRREDEPKG